MRIHKRTMIENKRVSMQHVVFMQIKLTSKNQTLECLFSWWNIWIKITEISTLKNIGIDIKKPNKWFDFFNHLNKKKYSQKFKNVLFCTEYGPNVKIRKMKKDPINVSENTFLCSICFVSLSDIIYLIFFLSIIR